MRALYSNNVLLNKQYQYEHSDLNEIERSVSIGQCHDARYRDDSMPEGKTQNATSNPTPTFFT